MKNAWYPILDANDLPRSQKIVRLKRFHTPMILWRESTGKLVAMEDRCAHKGAPLGLGKVKNDCIACPYHGIEFDAEGDCSHVPALGREAPRHLRVKTFSVREQFGFVWLWWGEKTPSAEVPFFPELAAREKHVKAYSCHYPASFHRVMESNSDGYHIDHLHKHFSPRLGPVIHSQRSELRGRFIRVTTLFKEESSASETKELINEILFPHSCMAHSPQHSMYNVISCAPIDDENTWFMVRFYLRPLEIPYVGRALIGGLNLISHFLLAPADFAMQSWQSPKETGLGSDKPLAFADAGMIEYWKMLQRELQEQEERKDLDGRIIAPPAL